MTIDFKSNIDTRKMSDDLLRQIETKVETELQFAATEIVRRTQSGRDADGSTFKPYTKQYAKYKGRRGRSGAVDLTFTGKMLGAIQTAVSTQGKAIIGKIFFNSGTEAKKAQYNQEIRRFFGLSKEQLKKLYKALTFNL